MSDSSLTPWTVAYQVPLSVGFPGLEYWSGLLFPSPGDLPDAGIEPESPALQVDSLLLSHRVKKQPLKDLKIAVARDAGEWTC